MLKSAFEVTRNFARRIFYRGAYIHTLIIALYCDRDTLSMRTVDVLVLRFERSYLVLCHFGALGIARFDLL